MSAVALEITELHKDFGKMPVIRGLSLTIATGERHALIGPNGAGKSTLFNLISGSLAPSAGRIRLMDHEITGKAPHEINRLGLARSFQVSRLFPTLTVFENLRCALLWSMGYRYAFWKNLDRLCDVRQRAEQLLARVGLQASGDTLAGALSYADQRALELAITVAGDAKVILLDEPTAGMSRSEAQRAVSLISEVTRNKTLLVIEHDMTVAFGLAERVTVLVQGRVLASAAPDAIRGNAEVRQAYLGTTADAA